MNNASLITYLSYGAVTKASLPSPPLQRSSPSGMVVYWDFSIASKVTLCDFLSPCLSVISNVYSWLNCPRGCLYVLSRCNSRYTPSFPFRGLLHWTNNLTQYPSIPCYTSPKMAVVSNKQFSLFLIIYVKLTGFLLATLDPLYKDNACFDKKIR